MSDCRFITNGPTIDPWCVPHERSAIRCQRAAQARIVELHEQLESLKLDASWKDRAVQERVRRVAAEAKLAAVRDALDMDADMGYAQRKVYEDLLDAKDGGQ